MPVPKDIQKVSDHLRAASGIIATRLATDGGPKRSAAGEHLAFAISSMLSAMRYLEMALCPDPEYGGVLLTSREVEERAAKKKSK